MHENQILQNGSFRCYTKIREYGKRKKGMKEILKKYKRQVQIAGGICLIAVLGIGGYVAANQDTAVQTQTEMKKETKSSDQKITKNDTKDAALEKKTDTKKVPMEGVSARNKAGRCGHRPLQSRTYPRLSPYVSTRRGGPCGRPPF